MGYTKKPQRFWRSFYIEPPIIAFKQNRDLHHILGKKTMVNKKKQCNQNNDQIVHWNSCNSKAKIYVLHMCNQPTPFKFNNQKSFQYIHRTIIPAGMACKKILL